MCWPSASGWWNSHPELSTCCMWSPFTTYAVSRHTYSCLSQHQPSQQHSCITKWEKHLGQPLRLHCTSCSGCKYMSRLPHAGSLSAVVGVVAEKAVLRGGLALPPGMLKGRHQTLHQTAACLVPHLHPSTAAPLLLTAITLLAPTPVLLSTATSDISGAIVVMQVQFLCVAVSAEAEDFLAYLVAAVLFPLSYSCCSGKRTLHAVSSV